TLVDSELRIAESWARQEFYKKAGEAVERLVKRKDLLTSRQIEELTAKMLGGPKTRVAFFNKRPDDEEMGYLAAVYDQPTRTQLALVRRLRQLPAPVSDDLRLDAVEAEATWAEDPTRATELLDRQDRRAKQLGARSEQAFASWMRGALVSGHSLQQVPL